MQRNVVSILRLLITQLKRVNDMNSQTQRFFRIICIFCYLFLSGCVAAAVPVVAGLAVAGAAVSIITVVNLARDQYPDINFDPLHPLKLSIKQVTTQYGMRLLTL